MDEPGIRNQPEDDACGSASEQSKRATHFGRNRQRSGSAWPDAGRRVDRRSSTSG